MELKTQALDRVLEALSPALAAELDRVVAETRQTLELEFQKRLQAAVREAEEAAKSAAEIQTTRAVIETQELTRKQVTAELEEKFRIGLAETTAELKNEASVERVRLQEKADEWRIFAETQQQLAQASSQSEILARFLKLAQSFAARLGLYIAKADGLALWKSRGEGAFPGIISQEVTDPESYFKTIVVRGKPVAAVCALPPFRSDALDFLAASLERAIEAFGLKLKAPAPKPLITSEAPAVSGQGTTAAPEGPSVPPHVSEAEDQKAHADARRVARLLVSEIKLYHDQKLKEGRANHDIYSRLHKEIDLGREMYSNRVPHPVLAAHDYFHEELVRILGENDMSRMGAGYPGPMSSPDVQ